VSVVLSPADDQPVFVLVHGAWHGGWCWDPLVAELARRDVVVVGHSLGGLTIPLVAARRPVRALVFVCALMPVPGRTVSEQRRDEPDIFMPGFAADTRQDDRGRSYWPEPGAAIADLYHDADRTPAEAAYARLRPQAGRPGREPSPLETWAAVPSVVIAAEDDRAISPVWAARAARERLGLDAIVLPGGHSPFMVRPAALADALLESTAEAPASV
jgi:pimeloyl-ACP methyl ester carboxylesterase